MIRKHEYCWPYSFRGYPIEQLALHSSHLETGKLFFSLAVWTKANSTIYYQPTFLSMVHCPPARSLAPSRKKSPIMALFMLMRHSFADRSGTELLNPCRRSFSERALDMMLTPWLSLRARSPILVHIIAKQILLCKVSMSVQYCKTFLKCNFPSCRPNHLHKRWQGIPCLDRQANIQAYRKGNNTCCVSNVCYTLGSITYTVSRMAYRIRQGREFVTPPTNLSYSASSVIIPSIMYCKFTMI